MRACTPQTVAVGLFNLNTHPAQVKFWLIIEHCCLPAYKYRADVFLTCCWRKTVEACNKLLLVATGAYTWRWVHSSPPSMCQFNHKYHQITLMQQHLVLPGLSLWYTKDKTLVGWYNDDMCGQAPNWPGESMTFDQSSTSTFLIFWCLDVADRLGPCRASMWATSSAHAPWATNWAHALAFRTFVTGTWKPWNTCSALPRTQQCSDVDSHSRG